MEHFQSRNLYDWFSANPGTAAQAVQVGRQAVAALAAAHQQSIVHRDIKPANVLMNDAGLVKVIDFGLAKACAKKEYLALSTSGCILGTPNYMSPEQVSSPADIDHRVDIYALGAVLYFCLTGRPPYVGKSAFLLLQQIGTPFPKPSSLRPDIPPTLEAIVQKATHRDRECRYQNVAELGAALAGLTI